ncbi:hypothetical protein [Bradyrhizobium japonicum]|uniref:hypothetical protein n=1 Tax=Bradyrhizobium japonicum TaxID=375 RepID=UPI001181899E|nr:hypothetical protein [Bradyrhizobium japonicum]
MMDVLIEAFPLFSKGVAQGERKSKRISAPVGRYFGTEAELVLRGQLRIAEVLGAGLPCRSLAPWLESSF